MRVNKIYVNTYKGDLHWCYICVASIRFWYPTIEIVLIKDLNKGQFDSSLLEEKFDVNVYNTSETFGWGYGKLEPLFLESKEEFLVLDSDTVLVGDVLSQVRNINSDFIIDLEVQANDRFNEIYYDKILVKDISSSFEPLNFSFNSGQWFGTSGIVSRSEFDSTIEWTSPRKNKYPHILKNGEQGHINYHFHRLIQNERINVHRERVMRYPVGSNYVNVNIDLLRKKITTEMSIVHWAGIKSSVFFCPEKQLIFFFLKRIRDEIGLVQFCKLFVKFIFPNI